MTRNQHSSSLKRRHRWLVVFGGTIGFLILIPIFVFALPIYRLRDLAVTAQPIHDFASADQAAIALVERDRQDMSLNPDCGFRYLKQPAKTKKVLVIRHGFTNCPRQFDELAQAFYDRGYSVLISRIPGHGLRDRQTDTPSQVTAEQTLVDLSHVIDIAQGLGEQVDIMGLSVGGNEVGMMAQQRSDIHNAVLINPFFGYKFVPASLTRQSAGLLVTIPDMFIWWDPRVKTDLPGPTSAYYGFHTRPLGEYLRMTLAIQNESRTRPGAQHITVIANGNDAGVNNVVTDDIARRWQQSGASIIQYRFPTDQKLNHDMIDPLQPDANTAITYPIILSLTDI